MKSTKNRFFLLFAALFLALTLACWFHSPRAESLTERRKLAQKPELTLKSFTGGSFASSFESYSQDQFPLREGFRTLKALFQTKVLGRQDNNNIYVKDGWLAQLEYPENLSSADYAASRFQQVYDRYLSGSSRVYLSVIPDKGYFLEGIPKMDHGAFVSRLREKTPFAAYIDLFPTLTLDSYYRTDTHWRQEAILPAAQALAKAMGKEIGSDFTAADTGISFKGVYAGQSALPVSGESMYYVTSPALSAATVWDGEQGKAIGVYDFDRLTGRDPYEFYLSGSLSLVTLRNEKAAGKDRLILFRDSFGSSIAPYFLDCYQEVTLVDIRYIPVNRLGRLLDFENADVLFLYSTLVLNHSETLK